MKQNAWDIVVVGAGPAGLAAAAALASWAPFEVLILEKGPQHAERSCPCNTKGSCGKARTCNVLYGGGGAATLHGAKLCGFPAGSGFTDMFNDFNVARAHRQLARLTAGGSGGLSDKFERTVPSPQTVLRARGGIFKPYPTEVCTPQESGEFVSGLLSVCHRGGVQVRYDEGVKTIEGPVDGFFRIRTAGSGRRKQAEVLGRRVVLATGRGGAGWIDDLLRPFGVRPTDGFVDLGLRLEAPGRNFQEFVATFGADPKLKFDSVPYPTRTFCACAEGHLVRVNFRGRHYVDGVFAEEPSGRGNVAIMARVPAKGSDAVRIAYDFMGDLAAHGLVAQDLRSFMAGTEPDVKFWPLLRASPANIAERLAPELLASLRQGLLFLRENMPSLFRGEVTMIGPAIDHYWSMFGASEGSFATGAPGLYLCGDALGLARGILQAGWSGVGCAEKLLDEAGLLDETKAASRVAVQSSAQDFRNIL